MPRMATLNYRHFGNPGRSYRRAHYNQVHKKLDESFLTFHVCITILVMRASVNFGGRGARRLVAAH